MAALAYSTTDADRPRPMATVGERMPGASASGILDADCGSTGRGLAAVFRASATIKLMAASLLRTSSALRYTPKDTAGQRLLGRATRSTSRRGPCTWFVARYANGAKFTWQRTVPVELNCNFSFWRGLQTITAQPPSAHEAMLHALLVRGSKCCAATHPYTAQITLV